MICPHKALRLVPTFDIDILFPTMLLHIPFFIKYFIVHPALTLNLSVPPNTHLHSDKGGGND